MNQKNSPPACILFFMLLIGFLVFYTGIPGTDDEQLFASAAQSYSLTGRFTADQVYGNKRLQGYYSSIAPLHAWIGALTYRLAEKLHTGGLQCFFLLSPFYSACTGYLLAKIGQRRGFSQKSILYCIIIFGFGTLVFAYSKSYFREPLAMLLITTAYYELDGACTEQPGSLRYTLRVISALVFLVLAIWTKEFLITCVPGLIYCFVYGMHKCSSESLPRKSKVTDKSSKYLLLVILLLIIILGALCLKDRSGRFSISYLSRLWTYFPLLNHAHFLE